MVVPGSSRGTDRSAWLLPVIVADKMQFKEFAWKSGLAVFRGATQVKLVPEPCQDFKAQNPNYKGTLQAKWMVEHIIYLPIHSFVAKSDLKVLSNRIVDIVTRYQMYLQQLQKQQEIDNRLIEVQYGHAKL